MAKLAIFSSVSSQFIMKKKHQVDRQNWFEKKKQIQAKKLSFILKVKL